MRRLMRPSAIAKKTGKTFKVLQLQLIKSAVRGILTTVSEREDPSQINIIMKIGGYDYEKVGMSCLRLCS